MMFANDMKKLNMEGTAGYVLAEDGLNASVRFCISQMFFIFCKKD